MLKPGDVRHAVRMRNTAWCGVELDPWNDCTIQWEEATCKECLVKAVLTWPTEYCALDQLIELKLVTIPPDRKPTTIEAWLNTP